MAKGQQCGIRHHATEFSSTGPMKGYYPIYVCDKPKHTDGKHQDSVAGKSWSER